MLEKTAALFERDATDRRPAVAEGTAADLPRSHLIGAILHSVLVHQTERGIRWQGRACAYLPEMSQNAPREKRDVLMYEREILGFLSNRTSPQRISRA